MRVPLRAATILRQLAAIAASLALLSVLTTVHAGLRGPGKYSGVVIFDRWGTCFLLSGPYITYISEAVKVDLRPYAGQAIQVDVTDISQPMNPGDGLITQYTIVGPAPDDPSNPIANRLEIEAEPAFAGGSAPVFDITIRNISLKSVSVAPSEVGPTILGTNRGAFGPSDGKSMAWITRADLVPRGPEQTAAAGWSSTVNGKTIYAKYRVEQPCTLKDRVELAASGSVNCRVRFDVSAGEYQFIVGYGGGVHAWKSIVSNAISFDVDRAGIATVEP